MPRIYIPIDLTDEDQGCDPIDLCTKCWEEFVHGKTKDQAKHFSHCIGHPVENIEAAFEGVNPNGEVGVDYSDYGHGFPKCPIPFCNTVLGDKDEQFKS